MATERVYFGTSFFAGKKVKKIGKTVIVYENYTLIMAKNQII